MFVQQIIGRLLGTLPANATTIPGLDRLPSVDPAIVGAVLQSLGIDVAAIRRGDLIDVEDLKKRTSVGIDLVVEDGIDTSAGKFPKALGNVVILEKALIDQLVNEFIRNTSESTLLLLMHGCASCLCGHQGYQRTRTSCWIC